MFPIDEAVQFADQATSRQDWDAALHEWGRIVERHDVGVHAQHARQQLALCYAHVGNWEAARNEAQHAGEDAESFDRRATAAGLHPPVHA